MKRYAACVSLLGPAVLLTLILGVPERAPGQTLGFGGGGNLYHWAYSPAFGRFLAGLEADYPLGQTRFRGQQLLIRPHVLYYWYFNELDFRVFLDQPVSINQEVELALSVGTKELNKFWLLWLDRIGIGYRSCFCISQFWQSKME